MDLGEIEVVVKLDYLASVDFTDEIILVIVAKSLVIINVVKNPGVVVEHSIYYKMVMNLVTNVKTKLMVVINWDIDNLSVKITTVMVNTINLVEIILD